MPGSSPPPASGNLLELSLADHLTEADLAAALAPVTSRLRVTTHPHRLLIDCRQMTGYDSAARALFVEWNRRHRRQIDRVAIVTTNTLWHMVISAMSLASRQEMRPFSDPAAAREWLRPAT